MTRYNMTYPIDSEINDRMDAFRGNPNALMQRYNQSREFIDLIALQKLKSEKEAAARDVQMKMQNNPNTIKAQREQELLDMTKDELVKQTSGLMALNKAKQQNNVQKVANMGVPPANRGIAGQPAPNMQKLAGGGIIGFQNLGEVKSYDQALVEMLNKKGISYRDYIKQEIEKVKNDPSLDNDAKREKISQLQSGTMSKYSGPMGEGSGRLYGKSSLGTVIPALGKSAKDITSQIGDSDRAGIGKIIPGELDPKKSGDFSQVGGAGGKPSVSLGNVDAYEQGVATPASYGYGSPKAGLGNLEGAALPGFKQGPPKPPEDKTGLKNLLINRKWDQKDFNPGDIEFSGIASDIESRVKNLKTKDDYRLKNVDELEEKARKGYLESDLIQKIIPGYEEKAKTQEAGLQKLIDSRQNELDRILERKQSDEPITSKDLRKYDFLNKVIKSRKKDKMYNGGMASNKKHMYATSGKVVDRRKK